MKNLLYFNESNKFYKVGDIVIIEYWYNDIITPCKIISIKGRKVEISHNVEESKINNAPNEIIKFSDIIDLFEI